MSTPNQRSAFTLLELLVVIGIIGILAGGTIVAINPRVQLVSAYDVQRRARTRSLQQAIQNYVIVEFEEPGDKTIPQQFGNRLQICQYSVTDSNCINMDELVDDNYIAEIPIDPAETTDYGTGFSVYKGQLQTSVNGNFALIPIAEAESDFIIVYAEHLGSLPGAGYGGGTTGGSGGSGGGNGGAGWGSASLLESTDENAGEPRIDAAANGDRAVIWNHYDGSVNNVRAAVKILSDPWTSDELVDSGSFDTSEADIAMGPTADAYAIWIEQGDVYVNEYASGWQTPVSIDSSADTCEHPKIDKSDTENVMAVWYDSDGVYAAYFENGFGWHADALISDAAAADSFFNPYVEMPSDGSDNAIAVWYQWDGARYNIYANEFDDGTDTWGSATEIDNASSDARYPTLARNFGGDAIAAYNVSGETHAVIYTDGVGWGTPAVIDDTNVAFDGEPIAAINDSGKAFVLYVADVGGYYNVYAAYYNGSSWGSPELLETMDVNAIEPDIAMDNAGNAYAVWEQNDDIYMNTYSGGSWGTATQLYSTGTNHLPEVDIGASSGCGSVIWYNTDSYIDIYGVDN